MSLGSGLRIGLLQSGASPSLLEGQVMAGNHELYAARSIALAAMGVTEMYVNDLKSILVPVVDGATCLQKHARA
eukprot:1847864-Amphidinium_carterae.1